MKLEEQIRRSRSRHAKPKKETWVKVEWIQRVTGWTAEVLRQAREQGLVQYKKEGATFLYKLESIHPYFLKKQKPTQ